MDCKLVVGGRFGGCRERAGVGSEDPEVWGTKRKRNDPEGGDRLVVCDPKS